MASENQFKIFWPLKENNICCKKKTFPKEFQMPHIGYKDVSFWLVVPIRTKKYKTSVRNDELTATQMSDRCEVEFEERRKL